MLNEKDTQLIQSIVENAMKESESRMTAYVESAIIPKFELLADGQKSILEQLVPKDEVKALRGEVELLKLVVRTLSQEIETLKQER